MEDKVRELCARFDVREIAFDPYLARNMLNNLLEDGLPAVEMRQGWVTMAPAIKELERAIIAAALPTRRTSGAAVECFSNMAVEIDKAGTRRFTRARSKDRIDGAQAAAMAVGRAHLGDTGGQFTVTKRHGRQAFKCGDAKWLLKQNNSFMNSKRRPTNFPASFKSATKTANDNFAKMDAAGKQAGDRMSRINAFGCVFGCTKL